MARGLLNPSRARLAVWRRRGGRPVVDAASQPRRCAMSGISGIGAGGINPYAVQQFQQNLFNQISGGSGSITQSGMEQAVTKAGGTTQAADALYSELDPANTGSVNEQQFAQALPGPPYSSQMQSQMIGYQAQGWPGASTGASATTGASLAQNLFSQID